MDHLGTDAKAAVPKMSVAGGVPEESSDLWLLVISSLSTSASKLEATDMEWRQLHAWLGQLD